MATVNGITTTPDGRQIIAGCGMLPAVEGQAKPQRKGKRTKQTAHRFAVLNSFVDCSLRDLSRVELATWLVLYRDTRDGIATTSQADIAKRIGASDRAVRSAIGQLQRAGLLVVVRRGGLLQGPSRYRVFGIGKRGGD